jgi:hypothetical protein
MARTTKVQPIAVAANDTSPVFQSLAVAELDGEPRIRDLDLAERLGFERPRKIRELIERNMAEITDMGVCPAVGQTHGPKGGRPTKEYFLNEEQALVVATLSNTSQARAVRSLLIKTFVAYRRGQIEAPAGITDAESRKVVGGIVKSIVHKEITDAIPHVVDRLVEQRLASDPRIAALDYVSVTDILEAEWKVPPKGRRSIQRRVLNRIKDHCLANGIRGSKAPYSGTWIFPRHEAVVFIRERCGAMIKDHTDKVTGQGNLLKLVKK